MTRFKSLLVLFTVLLIAAGCSKTKVSVTPTSCQFAADGGTSDVVVTANGDWSVNSCPDWITASVMSGSSDATLTLTALQNTSGSERSAEVVLGTEDMSTTIEVSQSCYGEDFLDVTPLSYTADIHGDTIDVTIHTSRPWSLSGVPDWIIPSAMSGQVSQTVTMIVTSAMSGDFEIRQADIVVTAGQMTSPVTIIQNKLLVIVVNPSSVSMDYAGGTATLALASSKPWTLNSAPDWVSVTPTSGNASGQISAVFSINPNQTSREGTLVFSTDTGSASVEVTQSGAPDSYYLLVDPMSVSFNSSGGSQTISVNSNADWTVLEESDWLSVSPASGSGDGSFVMTVTNNAYSTERVTSVFVMSGNISRRIAVTQQALEQLPYLTIDSTQMIFGPEGGTSTLHVTSNVIWTAHNPVDWLTLSTESGQGNGTIEVTAAVNMTMRPRSCVVNVTDGNINVVLHVLQRPHDPYISVDMTSIEMPQSGGDSVVTVSSNQDWKVSCTESWIHLNPTTGTEDGTFTVTVDPNMSPIQRVGHVQVIGLTDGSTTVTVTQSATKSR